MANYTANDLYFSSDGDFVLSSNKDLQDTSSNPHRALIQEVEARCNFRKNEWPGSGRDFGLNISDFVGKPNTSELADRIKMRVSNELTRGGFLSVNDFFVNVIPLDVHLILVKILIRSGNSIVPYNTRFSIREKSFGDKGEIT